VQSDILVTMFWRNLLPPSSDILRSVYQTTWHLTVIITLSILDLQEVLCHFGFGSF
jgi:hypothetical protein